MDKVLLDAIQTKEAMQDLQSQLEALESERDELADRATHLAAEVSEWCSLELKCERLAH